MAVAWDVYCSEALTALILTPRSATHGTWSAAQHTGVKRAIFLRSFRFAQRRLGSAGASPQLHALSEVANWRHVMRAVLRFAVPQCTPTRAELGAICTMCHTSDDTAALTRWLSCGVDPNTVDVDGDSHACFKGAPLLFIAVHQCHGGLIDGLVRSGADVDLALQNGWTSLLIAAFQGHLTVVTKLIAAGADVNKADTTEGCTPLYIAAQNGHTAIVSKLLQHGADKSIRGWQHETPLEAAQRRNHAAIVALLA